MVDSKRRVRLLILNWGNLDVYRLNNNSCNKINNNNNNNKIANRISRLRSIVFLK